MATVVPQFPAESEVDKFGEPRFLEQVKLFLKRASGNTTIPKDIYNLIECCNSVIRFNIPLVRDNGDLETIPCYRAQHSHHYLPVKGGTRYAMDINLQVSYYCQTLPDHDFNS